MYALAVMSLMIGSFIGGIIHKHNHPVESHSQAPVAGRRQLAQY